MTPAGSQDGLRVAAYVRISRDADDSTSIARQVDITGRYAAARGWEVVETVQDVDVSASKRRLDRPGLSRVRELVRAGEADAVLVWRLDRLARSVVDMGTLLDEGLQVVSCTEPLDTTSPMGRAMVEILQVFAALESSTIGQRVKSARDYLATNHRHPGGAVPYGYRSVPHPSGQGRVLEVDAVEAAHVRAAADHVLGGGSLYSATQLLRDRGAKPRRAAEWSLSSLRVVLTGDAILGRITHRGAVVRDSAGMPVQPWAPALPLEDANRLRALLATRPAGERRKRATRLLSGLVLCDGCGGNMRVSTSRVSKDKAPVLRYACHARSDGRTCPHPSSINCQLLEEWVSDGLLGMLGHAPMVEKIVTVRDEPELAGVNAALTDLGQQIAQPGADVAALAGQIAELQERRHQLDTQPVQPTVEHVETGQTYEEWWDTHEDVAQRRDFLRATGFVPVRIKPGQRGRKGLDPERVVLGDPFAAAGGSGLWERTPDLEARARLFAGE
ncbi:recombinase family protein [Nocardioides sp. 31GB23]|uniref:recombinase family protein n=1 Tax=Nocardioides sp. 31GB23 TaxID=3156065 RepID=UPI0032AEC494